MQTTVPTTAASRQEAAASAARFVLGRPRDWHLRRPTVHAWQLGRHWIGWITIVASCLVSWPAFSSAQGEGSVALGLWVGAVSIMLMAWSFVLAVRPKILEPIFGGLDSMYRAHRWAGTLAIVFMWLHTSIEPEIRGGIRGASRAVADRAEDLAGTGQTMLYALIGISLLRLIPYRWWRWTHKLLGVPFGFASWHFFTAEKTYANGSGWGWWFGAWMVAGLAAWLLRVVGIDMLQRGRRYTVVAADHVGTTTRLELKPAGKPLGQKLGQFAFLKLDVPGLREPHPFTIASSPDAENIEFMIRHLGDWSSRLTAADLVGRTAVLEGPYGAFEPYPHRPQPTTWIAGGVGITPFLAAVSTERDRSLPVPTLLYAVRDTGSNPMVDRLLEAQAAGRLDLHLFTPATGRMSPDDLDRIFPNGMDGHHVALCGPAALVADMANGARRRGAARIETEDFDIRQGFGPDRSREIADFTEKLLVRT